MLTEALDWPVSSGSRPSFVSRLPTCDPASCLLCCCLYVQHTRLFVSSRIRQRSSALALWPQPAGRRLVAPPRTSVLCARKSSRKMFGGASTVPTTRWMTGETAAASSRPPWQGWDPRWDLLFSNCSASSSSRSKQPWSSNST